MSTETSTGQATRRSFLGTAALTAASYKRVLGANDRIGVGQVGFGLIGRQHIADLKSFSDVDYVGLCDCYAPRVEEGVKFIGNRTVKGYSDFRKMYENKDIQAVVVATPDHWHALLTIMACAAGKDVYVEKPMTVFIDEGKWMVQAARKYKRIVAVGTQRRHEPGVTRRPRRWSRAARWARSIRSSGRGVPQYLSGLRQDAGRATRPTGFRLRHVAGAGAQAAVPGAPRPVPLPLVLGLLGRPDDQPGRAHHRSDPVDHERQGPDQRDGSMGGRFALEDDGETPDLQDAIWEFPGKDGQPGWTMQASIREASVGSPWDSIPANFTSGPRAT